MLSMQTTLYLFFYACIIHTVNMPLSDALGIKNDVSLNTTNKHRLDISSRVDNILQGISSKVGSLIGGVPRQSVQLTATQPVTNSQSTSLTLTTSSTESNSDTPNTASPIPVNSNSVTASIPSSSTPTPVNLIVDSESNPTLTGISLAPATLTNESPVFSDDGIDQFIRTDMPSNTQHGNNLVSENSAKSIAVNINIYGIVAVLVFIL